MQHISRSEITRIACASAGAFTGYAVAADKLDSIEYLYRTINITSKRELFWKVFAKGILSDYLDALLSHDDELTIPMCFPVCYMPIYSVEYYWIYGVYNRVWKKYLTAASHYPFLQLKPMFMRGKFAIDGGACDNIPLFPLLRPPCPPCTSENTDLIIIQHFDSRYDYRRNFVTDIPVLDIDLSYCNGFQKRHYDYSSATVADRLEKSFAYGESIAERLFYGDGSREYLRNAVNEIFLREYAERQCNLSLDRLVTVLNSVGRIFRKDSSCIKKLF